MVAQPARDDLEAVADQVVLERLDGERVLVFQRFHAALRHRERIVREVDLLLVLVPLEEGEIDDPGEFEAVFIDKAELLPCPVARRARELVELGRIAGREEHGIAIAEAQLGADRLGALLADVLGDGARALELVAFLAPEDIAKAGLALALCPRIHAVAEGARAAGARGYRPDAVLVGWKPGCWRRP